MQLTFEDKDTRELCSNESIAKQRLGVRLAEKLKSRLADLSAVSNASEVFGLPGSARELTGCRKDCIAIELVDGYQLVFQVAHAKPRLLKSGGVDWMNVRRVKIMSLGHGNA